MILDTGKEVFEKDKDFILTKKKIIIIIMCTIPSLFFVNIFYY